MARLREKPADFQHAHSSAADYHFRPFKAKQTVESQTKLGGAFAELRYHLVHAQRNGDLREVMHLFTNHLKTEIKSTSIVPTDDEELDERIGVLSILLEDGGAKGLEYHLTQCLKKSGRPGDLPLALIHTERATGPGAPSDSWVLRAQIEEQIGKIDIAVKTIYAAIESVSKDDKLVSLYQYGGELLAKTGYIPDALLLLRSGIISIPADKNVVTLYQSCADLLGRVGKTDDAEALLKEGIQRIPADKNLFSLYLSCAELLGRVGKTDDAEALLKEGIKLIPADKSLDSLYLCCAELLERVGRTDDAEALLKEGIKLIPADKNVVTLYQSCAELLGRVGRTDDAEALLKEGIKLIPADKNLAMLYQVLSEIYCLAGKPDEAIDCQREGLRMVQNEFNRYKLGERALNLCLAIGNMKKLDEILTATGAEALSPQQIALGEILKCQDLGDWSNASELAKNARVEFPRYFAFNCAGSVLPSCEWGN